jgi:hypothetical protein
LILFYGARVVRYGLVLTLMAGVSVLAIGAQGTPDAAAARTVESGVDAAADPSGFAETLRILLLFTAVAHATLGHWVGVGLVAFLHAAERPFYENAGLTTTARALFAWPLSLLVSGLLLVAGLGVGG